MADRTSTSQLDSSSPARLPPLPTPAPRYVPRYARQACSRALPRTTWAGRGSQRSRYTSAMDHHAHG